MAKIDETSPPDIALEQAGQDISRELQNLRADLAALVASLQRAGALGTEALEGRVKDLAGDSLAESLKAVRDLRQQVDALQGRLESDLRAHPLAWLLGALGLGLLVGLLFSHRR